MIEKHQGKAVLIHLEVNDYLKSKDERLFRYIDAKIAEAMQGGKEIILSSLTSYERKKVHGHITDKQIPGLKVWSVGEKNERAMHLSYQKDPVETRVQELTEDGIGI